MSTPKARACAAARTTKERPILFKAEMVRALLDGRKTQTRRIVKLPPHVLRRRPPHEILFYNTGSGQYPGGHENYTGDQPPGLLVRCSKGYPEEATTQRIYSPKGIPGDELYVRETFCPVDNTEFGGELWTDFRATPKYSAEHPAGWENAPQDLEALKWKPSIFMPRALSRIQLKVTGVRVERVQEITEDDAKAEGVAGVAPEDTFGSAVEEFAALWDTINGKKYPWVSDPHVWVYDFKRIDHE